MGAGQWTALLYSWRVDDVVSAFVSREEARVVVDEWLAGATDPASVESVPVRPSEPPDRATWGLLPEHQAGLKRAMGVVGVGAAEDGTATGDVVAGEVGP